MKKAVLLWFVITCCISACSSTPPTSPSGETDKNSSTITRHSNKPKVMERYKGSLFSDSYMFTLYEDRRAYRIGDILTVELEERTQSSKSAGASIDKESGIEFGVPFAGNLNVADLAMSVDSETEFDGSSSANQENFLRGSISVRVVNVLPNGALEISGEKRIKLNQGDEYIKLQGLVRPEDIDVANRISSQRIADAIISYSGTGSMAQASKAGWFTNLFNNYLNPF